MRKCKVKHCGNNRVQGSDYCGVCHCIINRTCFTPKQWDSFNRKHAIDVMSDNDVVDLFMTAATSGWENA